jgi:hypothetical protein
MIIDNIEVDRASIMLWLNRLLASQTFVTSHKHQKLLRYLVEYTLDGKAERLKGYSIAVDALGRTADFDPNQDAIVRVEASRLRAKLCTYYQNFGEKDEVQFHLLKGSYQIVFHFKSPNYQANNVINRRVSNDRRSGSGVTQAPINVVAQAAYLRGLEQYLKYTDGSMDAAKALFLFALEYDANHALAHAWLSRTLINQCLMQWKSNDEINKDIVELADFHASLALKINPALPALMTIHS